MDKRFVIAIVLVFVVLLLWPMLFGSKQKLPLPQQQEQEQAQETQEKEQKEIISEPKVLPQVAEETIIPIQTPLYDIQFTTEGARAISWKLKDYSERTKEKKTEQELLDLIPLTAQKCLLLGFHDPEIRDEMEDAVWSSDKESVEGVEGAQESLQFGYTTSTGMYVSKKLTFFPDSYFVDVDVALRNGSSEEMGLGGYSLYWGAGITKDELIADMEVAGEGPMALVTTEKGSELVRHWHKTGFACFGRKHTRIPEYGGPISWVGFASKYFTAVLIPGPDPWWSDTGNGEKRYTVTAEAKDTVLPPTLPPGDVWREWGNSTTVALVRPAFSMAPGETVLHTFRVYVGPKKWDILRSIEGRNGATEPLGLGKMINFGMFSPLGKATLWLLLLFHSMTSNYGVGIIFLTILIKILYFPLTQKSFKSMKKMQKLQPKIAALKEKHRDDPQRLQKETMKLYKQNKVNPMGGCLPLLFQLPVFWALFATLRGAVELRGAVFISGWVTDLSLSDTVARIGGFPINILPVLMTATMLLQQLMFSPGSQGQENKMMKFMPLIFAFIFYNMPSGLVLYWMCNNVLAIGHQYMIGRQDKANTGDQEEDQEKKTSSNSKGK